MLKMNTSILVKNQKQTHTAKSGNLITFCNIRFDDECGNGHNTFSITGDVYEKTRKRDLDKWDLILVDGDYYERVTGGCIHKTLVKRFPQFEHLVKFHLCSTEGPMHYKANTIYWAKQGDLDNARKSAVWEDASLHQLLSETALDEHLMEILSELKQGVESIGFTW